MLKRFGRWIKRLIAKTGLRLLGIFLALAAIALVLALIYNLIIAIPVAIFIAIAILWFVDWANKTLK